MARAALLCCLAVALCGAAMAISVEDAAKALGSPLTDAVFKPESMVQIASNEGKHGYYYRKSHKKPSYGGKPASGYKKPEAKAVGAKPAPSVKQVADKPAAAPVEQKPAEQPAAQQPAAQEPAKAVEEGSYTLKDGYYYAEAPEYHKETYTHEEYPEDEGEYEKEYKEYSEYNPETWHPKICLQFDALLEADVLAIIQLIVTGAGAPVPVTLPFRCCKHEEEEYKPTPPTPTPPPSYGGEYGLMYPEGPKNYGSDGEYAYDPYPSLVSPPTTTNPIIGHCYLTFAAIPAPGPGKTIGPHCTKLNITVDGTCHIETEHAHKCVPFGHYHGDSEVIFEFHGYLYEVDVAIKTEKPEDYSDYYGYYGKYPYVLTASSSAAKAAIASAEYRPKPEGPYYAPDGSEYVPAPYPKHGVERAKAFVAWGYLSDFMQCGNAGPESCHKSKLAEHGSMEIVLWTVDEDCKFSSGVVDASGNPSTAASGLTDCGFDGAVPMCHTGQSKIKIAKKTDYYTTPTPVPAQRR